MARSDRDTEGSEEYQHLRGDAVYGAVDDADDGDRETTRNIRHGDIFFLRGSVERTWNNCPAAVTLPQVTVAVRLVHPDLWPTL